MAEDPSTPSPGVQASGAKGTLAPGAKVAGYVIEEQVGAGGMAVVYRARDDVLGRLVAVKVLSPQLALDKEFQARFLRESRAVAAVDEPHIVPVYGAGEADGVLYIASRFVAGGDLTRVQATAGGKLPPAQAAEFITQIASALDAAHAAGLVHRDVKPGNVLVESLPGRAEHAYLSDFGLSKSTSSGATGLTATGTFMGTPDYCAPEQIAGINIDGRADQYSLACVGFSLLAGTVPFNKGDALARLFAHVNSPVPPLTSLRPDLPPAVDAVLARGMAKMPAQRFESCAAFAWAFRGALGFGGGPLSGTSMPPQAQGAAMGFQQTVTAGGWQGASAPPGMAGWPGQGPSLPPAQPGWPLPSVPPGPSGWQGPSMPPGPQGWQSPSVPAGPQGWQGPSVPPGPTSQPGAPGWQNPSAPPGQGGGFPLGSAGTVTVGAAPPWMPGGGQPMPGPGMPQGPMGPGPMGPGPMMPGQPMPGPGQMLRGPGHAQRPPRRNTGLIVGGSIAAVLLVAGIIVGVSLSGGGDDKGDGSSGGGTTSPSDGTGSTKTAHLAAALTAPGGGTLRNAFFSPDGKYVVAAGSSSDAYVWKAGTHQRVQTVSIGSDKLYPAAFSADDKTLYLIDDSDYELYSANIATGETSRLYYLPLSSTWYATWGSEVFAVVNTDGSISEYNMPANKAYAKVTNPGSAAVALVRPAADGKYVLIADKDGSSYLVEAKTGHVAGKFHYDYSSTSGRYPSVSLDGNTVYVPGEPGDPGKLWDRKTGTYITPTGSQWPNPDNGGTFAVDSQHIMTSPALASQDVDIWTIASRAHDATVVVPGSGNEQIVSIGPGAGQLLSTGGYDTVDGTYSTLNLWDLPK